MSAPRIGKERMVVKSFRGTAAQLRKFAALGGGAWLRQRIDAAPRRAAVPAERARAADDRLLAQSFRAEPAQLAKYDAIGGNVWLRVQLDSTPWPRGTK